MAIPLRTYVLRDAGYDAKSRDSEVIEVVAHSWPEAVSQVLGEKVGFTEPIAPRSSIHACYVWVPKLNASNKVGCVQHLDTQDGDVRAGFAPTLARLRESAGLTLADLGDAAGLSRQRIHQLEAGTHRPSWAEVQAVATALGVSTDTFRDSE